MKTLDNMNSQRKLLKMALLLTLPVLLAAQTAVNSLSSGELQKVAAKQIGNTVLPEQAPYLDKQDREPVFTGNGIVAGGGIADGSWNFLTGPDYTCPNYLSREIISISIDGGAYERIVVDMKRARKTGVIYGTWTSGDIKVWLIDFARQGDSWIARQLMVDNQSASKQHRVSIQAEINPQKKNGITHRLVKDALGKECGLRIKLDTSMMCVYNSRCKNWAERHATITFNESGATASEAVGVYNIRTAARTLSPSAGYAVSLCHYLDNVDGVDGDIVHSIRGLNTVSALGQCIFDWQKWFENVPEKYNLAKITSQNDRDIMEGGLAFLKMNQTRDGGIVANVMGWNMTYIRDGVQGAMRAFYTTGHFNEIKDFLYFAENKFNQTGYIANAWPNGKGATYVHPNGWTGYSCAEAQQGAEVTAYVLLAARDYFNATGDLQTLKDCDKSLRFCMDEQLKLAVANGYRLEFSADETELASLPSQSISNKSGLMSRGRNVNVPDVWSMTSIALCTASLEFYIKYTSLKGGDPRLYINGLTGKKVDLLDELAKFKNIFDSDFWRTDVAVCPGGIHDAFKFKSNGAMPLEIIPPLCLFPAYWGFPYNHPEQKALDVLGVKKYFNGTNLPLVIGSDVQVGHSLGLLLWCLADIGDSDTKLVHVALVATVSCWGTWDEMNYNHNRLRSLETGVNICALSKFLELGK